jgi:hypothetical protein
MFLWQDLIRQQNSQHDPYQASALWPTLHSPSSCFCHEYTDYMLFGTCNGTEKRLHTYKNRVMQHGEHSSHHVNVQCLLQRFKLINTIPMYSLPTKNIISWEYTKLTWQCIMSSTWAPSHFAMSAMLCCTDSVAVLGRTLLLNINKWQSQCTGFGRLRTSI